MRNLSDSEKNKNYTALKFTKAHTKLYVKINIKNKESNNNKYDESNKKINIMYYPELLFVNFCKVIFIEWAIKKYICRLIYFLKAHILFIANSSISY